MPTDPNSRVLEPGEPLRLLCQVCQHEWDFPWEKGMLLEVLVVRMNANRLCPSCGNRSRAKNKGIMWIPRGEVVE